VARAAAGGVSAKHRHDKGSPNDDNDEQRSERIWTVGDYSLHLFLTSVGVPGGLRSRGDSKVALIGDGFDQRGDTRCVVLVTLSQERLDSTTLVRRLLEGLSEEQRRSLLATARRHRYAPGEVVFHEGDPADSLHMIERGRVSVGLTTSYGDQVTFAIQSEGEVFGELALLSAESRRTATVTALERTETMVILRDDFDRMRRDQPQVTEALLWVLAARVRMLSDRLSEAMYVPAEVRVLRRLLEVAETYSSADGAGSVPLTQDQLGDLAGTARATVNRVLRREAARGALRLERGRITILDRGAIAARSR
jgi:CRP-like cAMP-binding protein